MTRRLLLLLGTILLVSAGSPLRAQQPAAQSPAVPPRADTLSLRPGDVLRVRVWPDSSMSGDFPVEDNGEALLPVVGSVQVTGATMTALRADLRRRYEQAMKAPVVTILPVFRVSLLGGVLRPGLYQVDPNMTLMDVISLAGGFTPDARQDQVRVVRQDRVLHVNAREALARGNVPEALQLHSGDRVVVPQHHGVSAIMVLQSVTLVLTIINLMRR